MSPFQKTHLNHEDRKFIKEQQDWAKLSLARAEDGNDLAKSIRARIELKKQQDEAILGALQVLSEDDNELTDIPPNILTVKNKPSLTIQRDVTNLEQVAEDVESDMKLAKWHIMASSKKLKGKITPTALVKEFKANEIDLNNKYNDISESLKETKTFPDSLKKFLISGEKKDK